MSMRRMRAMLEVLRDEICPEHRPAAEEELARLLPEQHATSYVTGTTAGTTDFTSQITSRLPWLILAGVHAHR